MSPQGRLCATQYVGGKGGPGHLYPTTSITCGCALQRAKMGHLVLAEGRLRAGRALWNQASLRGALFSHGGPPAVNLRQTRQRNRSPH